MPAQPGRAEVRLLQLQLLLDAGCLTEALQDPFFEICAYDVLIHTQEVYHELYV